MLLLFFFTVINYSNTQPQPAQPALGTADRSHERPRMSSLRPVINDSNIHRAQPTLGAAERYLMKGQGYLPYDQPLGHPPIPPSPTQQQLKHGQSPQQLAQQGHQQNQQHNSQQPQHQLSRQSQTVSAGSSTPPSSSGEPRKISCQDIQQVQNLIERCLQLYMNQTEVVNTLLNQAKIEPGFTGLVWQKLEEQNPDFFKAYYTRLTVKQQITKFNQLLQQHVELIQKMSAANVPSPISNGLHSAPMKHMPTVYPVQQPAIPRIHTAGDNLGTTNACLINGGACFSETVHTSEGNSISSGRMDITSGMPPVLHSHSGISPKRELPIQGGSGFSNNSRFSFSAIGNPTDMPSTAMDVSVPSFNSNEAQIQSEERPLQESSAYALLGQIPRNFSLSDLTADFSHASDILGSYSGSPFLTPDVSFLHSPENEGLDDDGILDTISEQLSYEEFASDG